MKKRLVNTVQPMIGLTLRKIYEGTAENGFFRFNDDHGDERTRPDHEFEAVSSEKPEVGQWWLQTNKQDRSDAKYFRAFFCGHAADGNLLFESVDGSIEKDAGGLDWSGWHYEPECTGWDWVPEVKEAFPQWYVSDKWEGTAYIKRIDAETAVRVALDGKEKEEKPWSKHGKECVDMGWYTKTTQADAEARVAKKPKVEPAESPDDWVTQDRVPPRLLIDEVRWVWKCRTESTWNPVGGPGFTIKHGFVDAHNDRFEVRCRRKDLPVVETKTTATVTVCEVVFGDDIEELGYRMVVGDSAMNSVRKNWKYVSVVSTKTVEVML